MLEIVRAAKKDPAKFENKRLFLFIYLSRRKIFNMESNRHRKRWDYGLRQTLSKLFSFTSYNLKI